MLLCPVSAQFPAGGNFRQQIWIILTSDTLRLELTNSQSQPQNGVTFSPSDMIDSPQNIYIYMLGKGGYMSLGLSSGPIHYKNMNT